MGTGNRRDRLHTVPHNNPQQEYTYFAESFALPAGWGATGLSFENLAFNLRPQWGGITPPLSAIGGMSYYFEAVTVGPFPVTTPLGTYDNLFGVSIGLTPTSDSLVPEPSSLVLAVFWFVGLAACGCRRRSCSA